MELDASTRAANAAEAFGVAVEDEHVLARAVLRRARLVTAVLQRRVYK